MAKIALVAVADVEYIAHRLAKRFFEWNEPIPDFGTRFPNILESCLAVPFQTFARQTLYKGLLGKSSILFYVMIKNHPFQNENKRIAITTLLIFLRRNGKWLKVDNQKLYNFAKWVASTEPELKDATVTAIRDFLRKYLIDIS